MSGLVKRSFTLAGHRTSVALEPEFWTALAGLAARRGTSLSALVAEADARRDPVRTLASALRVLALAAARAGQTTHPDDVQDADRNEPPA